MDPGNLNTDLYRNFPGWQNKLLSYFLLNDPIYGAYTLLFSGLSTDITMKDNGRFGELRNLPQAWNLYLCDYSKAVGSASVCEERH